MSKRTTRAQVAQQTLTIMEEGSYLHPTGARITLRDELAAARSCSVLYAPDDFQDVFRRRDELLRNRPSCSIAFEVVNETTLHAARRLAEVAPGARVLALNFASARHPGGGFLNGSQAQEESLARASGLYACISQFPAMYETNRCFPSCLYTDHQIYTPEVPVFRDDEDHLLDQPYLLSIITAPAVNAGVVRRSEPRSAAHIEPTMLARIEKVLSLAVLHGHDTLVLGAWGFGVFANNPPEVAAWFARHLTGDGLFHTAFQKVVFAVLDTSPDGATIRPFQKRFAKTG